MLAAIGEHQKIVLPAILRYVFGGCCKDPTHAPNTSLPTHSTSALAEHVRQRNTIIRKLHDLKTQHHKVLDILSTFSATSSNFPEKCASLKKYCTVYTLWDNIHLTDKGYELLADNIITEAKTLRGRQSSSPSATANNSYCNNGKEFRPWGGFFCTSGVGKTAPTSCKQQRRGGAPRHHPYHRN